MNNQPLIDERSFRFAVDTALSQLKKRDIYNYLEFGVYDGTSMSVMYNLFKDYMAPVQLFGFDSFQGMPPEANTEEGSLWTEGIYKCEKNIAYNRLLQQGVLRSDLALIEGFFKDTLNEETKQKYGIRKADIIMIDSDLYYSAKLALDFCADLIKKDCLIIFDNWYINGRNWKNLGEKKAFDEFLRSHQEFSSHEVYGYYINNQPTGSIMYVRRKQ